MKFTRYRDLCVWPQDEGAEGILVVHHVEKRESRVGPRRRQKLEERSVRVVVWISVAGAPRMAGAQPWLQTRKDPGLEPTLDVKHSGTLILNAPASGLARAPHHHIDGAAPGLECMQRVAAECVYADVREIRAPGRQAPVVRF